MNARTIGGISLLVIIAALLVAMAATPLGDRMSLEALREGHAALRAAVEADPFLWAAGFFCAAVLATSLSFPAGPVIGIAAGALFGFWQGLAMMAVAVPIGSTIAFLASRYWLREGLGARLPCRAAIDRGIEEGGAFYLLALRINPFVPYWLVNLAAGLTRMGLGAYVPATILGLFPATLLYVTAGSGISAIESGSDAFPPAIVAALFLLSILPLAALRLRARGRRAVA